MSQEIEIATGEAIGSLRHLRRRPQVQPRGEDAELMHVRSPPRIGRPPGFVHLGRCKSDEQFGLFRVEGDPVLAEKDRQWRDGLRRGDKNGHAGHNGNGHAKSEAEQSSEQSAIDWTAEAKKYAEALTPERRHELAEMLSLPEATLTAMPLLGFGIDWDGREMWTFPEVDGDCANNGIRRRFKNGEKKTMQDAKPGLTVLDGWDRGGPGFFPEGASDTFVINAMGLTGAGRPSNTGGVEHLIRFLRDFPSDRRIIILGENDKKEDGKWPGLDGAKSTAAQLRRAALGRPVDWCLPPDGAKDARAWAATQVPDREDMDAWSDAGEKFAQACLDQLDDDEKETDADDFAPDDSTFRPFPLAALPEPIRSYVDAGAAAVGCDPSFVALPMLSMLAGAVGNSRRILLKKGWSGWSEPCIIWTAIIGESGTTKSPGDRPPPGSFRTTGRRMPKSDSRRRCRNSRLRRTSTRSRSKSGRRRSRRILKPSDPKNRSPQSLNGRLSTTSRSKRSAQSSQRILAEHWSVAMSWPAGSEEWTATPTARKEAAR